MKSYQITVPLNESQKNAVEKLKQIRAITFDLDDTLWCTRPIIKQAEATLHQWLGTHYPRITAQYNIAHFMQMRKQLSLARPELSHDLTALRIETLKRAASECGYPEAMAAEAFEVFIHARNQVTFFADVIPALQQLTESYILGALTNGNADIQRIGIGHLFDFSLTAEGVGSAKPDPAMFRQALEQAGVEPHEMLHVGDDHHSDICGASATGIIPIWINREDMEWQHDAEQPLTIHNLTDLTTLLQL